MQGPWHRKRLGRVLIGVALAGLLVPNMLTSGPSVVRAADYAVTAFDIADSDEVEYLPRVSGQLVVYTEVDAGGPDIILENLDDDDETRINELEDFADYADIDGDVVVYNQADAGDINVYGYDLSDDDHFEVATGAGSQFFPAISGNRVVYQDNSAGNYDIRVYDIDDDETDAVSDRATEEVNPAIDGDLVAWEDYRDGPTDPDIWAKDLSTDDTFQVSTSGNAHQPTVSGDRIVYWTDDRNIVLYDRSEGTRRNLNTDDDGDRYFPRINGDIVVWQDYRDDDGGDIYGYDLANDQEFVVDDQGDAQSYPDVDGDTIVWMDESNNSDIRGGTLEVSGVETPTEDEVPPTPDENVVIPPPIGPFSCAGKPIFASGFCIENATIENFYMGRGGRDTFGDPISRTFLFRGTVVQFFQRHIIEIGPDGGARLPNLLDPGLMPVNQINFSTYPPVDDSVKAQTPNAADLPALIAFIQQKAPESFNGQPVKFFTTFSGFVTCDDAFPNGGCIEGLISGFNLEVVGAVTSNPAPDPNNPNFIYQRFQRTILHYDANCQCTQALLLASYFADVLKGTAPADLMAAMGGTPYISQYNNAMPGGMNRPGELPDTNMQNAFQAP